MHFEFYQKIHKTGYFNSNIFDHFYTMVFKVIIYNYSGVIRYLKHLKSDNTNLFTCITFQIFCNRFLSEALASFSITRHLIQSDKIIISNYIFF